MVITFLLLLLLCWQPVMAETTLELIESGRLMEAQVQTEDVDSLVRYKDYLAALFEDDAVRACSLYQLVSYRYPGTDVDRLAQDRLLAFQQWGQSLPPFIAPGMSSTPEFVVAAQNIEESVAEPIEPTTTQESVPEPEKIVIEEFSPEPAEVVPEELSPEPAQETTSELPVEPETIEPKKPEPSVRPVIESPQVPHDIEPLEGGSVWIQVGAFGVRENADQLAEKLRRADYHVVIISKQSKKSLLHFVRVGAYPSSEAALAIGEKLKQDFGLGFYLVEE